MSPNRMGVAQRLWMTLVVAGVLAACGQVDESTRGAANARGEVEPIGSATAAATPSGRCLPTADDEAPNRPASPPNAHRPACSENELRALEECATKKVFTTPECKRRQIASDPCSECIFSAETDATWGAIVLRPHSVDFNIAGCLEVRGHLSCAERFRAHAECVANRCAGCDPDAHDPCLEGAEAGPCAATKRAVTLSCATADTTCLSEMGVMRAFCGERP